MYMKLKEQDLRLVAYLRQNSRENLTRLSKKTQIPVSTIFDKLRNRTGYLIKRNTCLIDFNKIGLSTRAQVVMKVKPEERVGLKEYLLKNRNVNTLLKINNGYDFMIDVVFRNLKELEEFLEKTEDNFRIKSKQVYYVIDEIESEKFLADPLSISLIDVD